MGSHLVHNNKILCTIFPVSYPSRKRLDHRIPAFAQWDATYFLTICCVQRGTNSLCRSEAAAAILSSVQTYETLGKWSVRIMLLMPDHLFHALVDFPFWGDMGQTVQQWKRFLRNHHAITFQRNFFDHRLRKEESHDDKWKYIKMNRYEPASSAIPKRGGTFMNRIGRARFPPGGETGQSARFEVGSVFQTD